MREKQWAIYHKLENKQKQFFLKKLSEKESFKILSELYKFAYNLSGKSSFNILDMDKIKTLVKVRSLFGKVKR